MSQLVLRGHDGSRFDLNITQFRSPMSASINSVQTRTRQHHFPIRAGQPDIQFTAHFTSVDEKHRFQDFVREHQLHARMASYGPTSTVYRRGAVTLMWPRRNIENWTGYITSLPVREPRFEYAPRVTFGVTLMDSLMSATTTQASLGNSWWSIRGPQIVPWQDAWLADSDFRAPDPPSDQQTEPQTTTTRRDGFQTVTDTVTGIGDLITGLFR